MNTREKRTQTEPGLGTASGDARQTQKRSRSPSVPPGDGADRPTITSEPPTSAPPVGTGAGGAPPSARHTKELERRASRSISRPAITPVPRAPESTRGLSREDEGSSQRMEDTPFDRIEQLERRDRLRRAPTLREEGGGETPRAPAVSPTAPPRSQRPIEGRPVSHRPSRAPEPRGVSSKPPSRGRSSVPPPSGRGVPSKPVSGRPARTSTAPKPSVPPSRPAKSQRASIRVDDLGDAVRGVGDALGGGRQTPKLLRSKDEIAAAPIDHRAGFLLTFIDGVTTVQGLVDMAVMPEDEVHEILDRLRRLGIIALK